MRQNRIREFIHNELSGWKKWEICWLLIACAVILGLSLYWHDTAVGIICATTGVASVVCTGKGKLSAYLFGTVNVVLYTIISWEAKYYGEVMLNALYYFPMEFYGFYVWSRHMNQETHEVEKKRMKPRGRLIMTASVLIGTLSYGWLLQKLGGTLPYVDALSTVVSVVAMIISVKMFMEQWILWIMVDIVTIIMWGFSFWQGNDSIATLLMWIVYLFNAVIMYVKWKKEAKANAV